MPPHVCRCGGAGWDGCRPDQDDSARTGTELSQEMMLALQSAARSDPVGVEAALRSVATRPSDRPALPAAPPLAHLWKPSLSDARKEQ